MVGDEATRLALLEEKFNRFAEDMGILKTDQTKTNEWINSHKLEEITRHNTVINAINKVSDSVDAMREKGIGKLAAIDRAVVIIPAFITMVIFGIWVYNQIRGTPIALP